MYICIYVAIIKEKRCYQLESGGDRERVGGGVPGSNWREKREEGNDVVLFQLKTCIFKKTEKEG